MRLIDADALENMGYELHRTYRKDANTMVYEVKEIADAPTIKAESNSCEYWDSESHFCALRRPQAEPVRRGQWNTIQGDIVVCSICGTSAPKMITGCLVNRHLEPNRTNYCPTCGARMEEQE